MKHLSTKIDKNFSYSNIIKKVNFKETSEITFEYISDFRSAKILRDFIGELAQKLNIDKLWEKRFILIVDELNNNAIEYWTKPWDYNKLKVFFKFENDEIDLQIEVIDKWNGKMPKTSKEMEQIRQKKENNMSATDYKAIRWRWLFMIISQLVDEIYFKDAPKWGLIVWIRKKLKINKNTNK